MTDDYVVSKSDGIVSRGTVDPDQIVRTISSKEDLEEIIERMPYLRTIQAPNNKLRRELYQSALDTYDVLEWVKLIKTVYLRMQDKQYEAFEPEYQEKAKAYLYGEMAIRFGIPLEAVEQHIGEAIEMQK